MEQHEETQEPAFVKVNVRPRTRRHLHDLAQIEERSMHVIAERAVEFYRKLNDAAKGDLPDPSRLDPADLVVLIRRGDIVLPTPTTNKENTAA